MLKRTRPLFTQLYAKTLNLPRSTFPPRPDVSLRPALLKQCADDLYRWQAADRPATSTFTLHDGPPYANGPLHIGHALNKVLKDVFNRFQCSQGKRVHYRPGWDCHGLPIELKALQGAGTDYQDIKSKDAVAVRSAARALANSAIKEQMQGFKSWGIMGDWDIAYKSMDPGFEIKQLEVFRAMVGKGLIYRQFKPVYWSPSSGTALAEAELEYDENHVSQAAYIRFELVNVPESLRKIREQGRVYVLIWTTTPWTLPANRAIAFHDELEYCVVRADHCFTIVATSRLEHVVKVRGQSVSDIKVVEQGLKGKDLGGGTYKSPLNKTAIDQPLIHANFVSEESGSGLVHIAPGHGFDDYNICQTTKIEPFAPVDDSGCFTEAAHPSHPAALTSVQVLEGGSQRVLELLSNEGNSNGINHVWAVHDYTHKYPIDWRTKLPVIIRATAQWFANVDQIKDQALSALESVDFTPESGKSRLTSFVLGRSHWCISRQRAWGVPIPALFRVHDDGRQEPVMTTESVAHIIEVIKQRGTDAWWTDAPDDPRWIVASLPAATYVRGKDTMDVWFDSGTTWTQIPETAPSKPPADVYLEGTDQHRGWFQSSLLTHIARCFSGEETAVAAPFKRLITHGFILDQQGRKMSKSIGNVVSPMQIMDGSFLPPLKLSKKQKQERQRQNSSVHDADKSTSFDAMGPDALRLWAASNDYTSDVPVGAPILSAINTTLHKYRVTLKWLLGVLSDYTSRSATVRTSSRGPRSDSNSIDPDLSDSLALHDLKLTARAVHAHYAAYEPYKAMTALSRYTTNSLSSFYFETAKDLLYTGNREDRSRVQAVCYKILHNLLAMLAPVTPLLVQETLHYATPGLRECIQQRRHDPFRDIWQPAALDEDIVNSIGDPALVSDQPHADGKGRLTLAVHAQIVYSIRAAVREAQERARATPGRLGSGLDCAVQIVLPAASSGILSAVRHLVNQSIDSGGLARALVVSHAESAHVSPDDQPHTDHMTDKSNADLNLDAVTSADIRSGLRSHVLSEAERLDWVTGQAFSIRLAAKDTGSKVDELIEGAVLVMPPTGDKCPRCWRFVLAKRVPDEDCRADDEVCERCAEALAERVVEKPRVKTDKGACVTGKQMCDEATQATAGCTLSQQEKHGHGKRA